VATRNDFFDDRNDFDWSPWVEDALSSMDRYTSFMGDEMSQWLLDTAYFNDEVSSSDRGVARAWVEEYWINHWGYVFHDQFDWNLWRAHTSP
jgi:hypothetical protein